MFKETEKVNENQLLEDKPLPPEEPIETNNKQLSIPSYDEIEDKYFDDDNNLKNEINTESDKPEEKKPILNQIKAKNELETPVQAMRNPSEISPEIPNNFNLKGNQNSKDKKTVESILTIIYTIIYIFIVFSESRGGDTFKINNSIRNFMNLSPIVPQEFMNTEVTTYITNIIQKIRENDFILLDHKYEIFTNIRLTSRRSKFKPNMYQSQFNGLNVSYFETKYISPLSDFDGEIEENAPYNKFNFSKDNSFFKKGGYVLEIKKENANKTQEEINLELDKFILDSQIRTVIIDFLLENYELNLFVPLNIIFDFTPSGIVRMKHDICIMDLNVYDSLTSYVRLVLEILSFLICVFLLIYVIVKLIKRVNYKYEKLSSRKNSNKSSTQVPNKFIILMDHLKNNLLLIILIVSLVLWIVANIIWIIYIIKLFKVRDFQEKLFENVNNQITFEQNDLAFSACHILTTYKSIVTINFLLLLFRNIEILTIYFPSIGIFITTISYALSDLLSFIVFYIILILGTSIFTFFFYGKYVPSFNNLFSSIQQNMSFTMGSIDFSTFDKMSKHDQILTLLYLIFIIYFLKYIVIKILLAIIFYFYKISYNQYEGKEIEARQNQEYTKEKVKSATLVRIWNFFKLNIRKAWKNIFSCFNCFKKKIRANNGNIEIKIEGKEENTVNLKTENNSIENKNIITLMAIEDQIVQAKDLNQFNTEYNDDYYFYLRTPYFDSQNDESKLKQYYETRYYKVYLSCLFYIIFVTSLIAAVLLQTFTPWRARIQISLSGLINNPILNEADIQQQYDNINNQNDLKQFVFEKFPSYFEIQDLDIINIDNNSDNIALNPNSALIKESRNLMTGDKIASSSSGNQIGVNLIESTEITPNNQTDSFFVLRFNQLIQNKLLLTVKKIKYRFDDGFEESDMTRYLENLDLFSNMKYEMKETVKINNSTIEYKVPESYRKLGGYSQIIDIYEYNMDPINYISEEVRNFLIDPSSTFIIIEFILDNVEFKIIQYVEMIIKYDYGTFYQNELNTHIFQKNLIDSNLDYIQYAAEIIFIIFLVYHVVIFINDTIKELRSYQKWYQETITKLSLKTRELRNHYAPEYLRKLFYLIRFQKIFEFSILVLSISLVVFRILIIISESKFKKLYDTNEIKDKPIYEIRELVYSIVDLINTYQMIGVITIFLASLRFIVMMRLGKYFFLLIKTIDSIKGNYIKFIFIFVMVHLAFILYSYYSFGLREYRYYQIGNTIMFSINMIFGNLDWEIYNSADSFFGPLFFFLFVIIVNMILLNLFISIIDTSYVKVTYELRKTTERWSFIRVAFSCCFRLCGKKKINFVSNERKRVEMEFQSGKLVTQTDLKIDIHKSRYKFEDWMEEELEKLFCLNQKLKENNLKLKKIENGYYSNLAQEYNIFSNDEYKNVNEEHFSCFNLLHTANLLSTLERLEEDLITIEDYQYHLSKYEEYSDLIQQTNHLKNKYTSLYPESMMIKNKIGKNLIKIDQMKKDLDELNSLTTI